MTAEAPRVTVVVTSYNQAELIGQALDSVAAQTEPDLELIVTDDGSVDGSRTTIEAWLAGHDLQGRLVAAEQNVGLPAMLNRALPLIRGDYVVVLNGDDWMESDRLEVQAAALDGTPDVVGLVYSDLRVIDADGAPTGDIFPPPSVDRREGDVLLHIIKHPMIGMPSVMFRRSVLDQIGPWDETLVADDFDFLLRVAAAGYQFRYLPAVIVNYRKDEASMTGSLGAELAEARIRALLKLLGRDRETDRAILWRAHRLTLALHGMGHDRAVTRHHLWFLLRHAPSSEAVRALTENVLRMHPRALSPQHAVQGVLSWSRSLAKRSDSAKRRSRRDVASR